MSDKDLKIECPSCGREIPAEIDKCPMCGAGLIIAGLEELEELARSVTDENWLSQPPEEPEVGDITEPIYEEPEAEEDPPEILPPAAGPKTEGAEAILEETEAEEKPISTLVGGDGGTSISEEITKVVSRKEKKALKRQEAEAEEKARSKKGTKEPPPLEIIWEKGEEKESTPEDEDLEDEKDSGGLFKRIFGRRKD